MRKKTLLLSGVMTLCCMMAFGQSAVSHSHVFQNRLIGGG
jgi:hypothetical protein